MTAKIMDDNGHEITRTIEKEAVIPDISEYGEKESFSGRVPKRAKESKT